MRKWRLRSMLGCCALVAGLVPTATSAGAAVPTAIDGTEFLAVGVSHSCAVTDAGGAKCWGSNQYGAIGDGTTTHRLEPTPVSGLASGVESISGGWEHTCAVTDTGAVKCWGNNLAGQLGDGTLTSSSTPVGVGGLDGGIAAVSAGVFHTCALTDAGGVKCWGANDKGQLGDGTTTSSATPVDVTDLTSGAVAVVASWRSTCAVTDTGGVKCWGHNNNGQLGNGTTNDSLVPVDVTGLTSGVHAISADGGTPDLIDGSHACAVTESGGVKCWGYNALGQLGDGTTTERHIPVEVTGLGAGVAAITVGDRHSCALTASGGVKCWGENVAGKLGDGTDVNRLTPVDVVGLGAGVVAVSAGEYHNCVVTTAGGVKCWGANVVGRLGNGVTEDSFVPVDVSGSFYRDECPTLIAEAGLSFTMSDGYAVGSVATFTADPGYALAGDGSLTCLPGTTWDGSPPTTESADPDVVVASGSGARSTWFPTVERLHNGTLVVVYYDASSHTGPDGRIALTRSRDGGRTWSPPTVAIDTPLDDRDPSVVELSNGTLVLSWFEADWSTSPLPTPGGVWTARSTDGGRTWSPPTRARSARYGEGEWTVPPVGSATPGIATSAKIVELRDRSLLLPVYGNTPDDPSGSITLLRSLDGGRTWPPSLELPVATHPPGNSFAEPALALLGDGSLQMAIRTYNVGYWTSSRDGGVTWSPPEPTGSYYEQASDLLPIREGGRRRLLHTWGDPSTLLGPGRPTAGRIITRDGVRHQPKVIYSGGAFDESYPSSVQVGPGKFFTVFYDAQRKIIGGTYSRISEYSVLRKEKSR